MIVNPTPESLAAMWDSVRATTDRMVIIAEARRSTKGVMPSAPYISGDVTGHGSKWSIWDGDHSFEDIPDADIFSATTVRPQWREE